MAVDHLSGKTEGNTEFTDFVLKEAAQRLKKLQMKRVGQAAYIVVALNNLGFFGFCTGRLNHVRVDRALSKPFGVFDFGSFFLEDVDEFTADDLTLLLGIGNTCQSVHEAINGVHHNELQAHVLFKSLTNLFALILAQQTIVDENAGQTLTDCTVDERCGDGTVDAA